MLQLQLSFDAILVRRDLAHHFPAAGEDDLLRKWQLYFWCLPNFLQSTSYREESDYVDHVEADPSIWADPNLQIQRRADLVLAYLEKRWPYNTVILERKKQPEEQHPGHRLSPGEGKEENGLEAAKVDVWVVG